MSVGDEGMIKMWSVHPAVLSASRRKGALLQAAMQVDLANPGHVLSEVSLSQKEVLGVSDGGGRAEAGAGLGSG